MKIICTDCNMYVHTDSLKKRHACLCTEIDVHPPNNAFPKNWVEE
jgi:hypothetical protein